MSNQSFSVMPIYLDYQATTPCDERVVEKMLPYLTEKFGNPHSRNHTYGWTAEQAVESARFEVANALVGVDPREIIFTSGATESNNLAIKGVARFLKDQKDPRNHLITCRTEHKCVLESFRALEQEGFRVTFLPVQPSGLISLEALEDAITPETCLVSIMAVNNEIGVIQDLKAIGALCRKKGIYFHTDAAQGFGRMVLDVNEMNIDLMSLSSHKIYGPKGIGALYVRRRPRVRLRPLFSGGGQERGLRSGTMAPFLCVGFGEAARLAEAHREEEGVRLMAMRQYLVDTLFSKLEAIRLNGDPIARVPGNLNVSFLGVEGEGLMMGLKNLALSSGSACTSASLEPSYVLHALGIGDEAHTSLRITLGRYTTWEDIQQAAQSIVSVVTKLRSLSPLWEMYQEGVDLQKVQWVSH